MIKRVTTLFQQDFTVAMRDNIILYMMIAPMVLATLARLFLPSLDNIQVTFAVERSVGEAVIAALQEFGAVDLFDSRAEVLARVERMDDVAGVAVSGDGVEILLEGNEPEGAALAGAVLRQALNPTAATPITNLPLGGEQSRVVEYAAMIAAMMGMLLGALVGALVMVDEKETQSIKALAVAPLRLRDYTVARALFALAISLVNVLAASTILLGTAVPYGQLLLGFLFASGIAVVIGYSVGGFADNQLGAIAIIKVLLFVYLSIPVTTIWIPQQWHIFFYPLPNYWMWKIFENIYIGQIGPVGFWGACALTLAGSAIIIGALIPFMKRRLALR
ncbi:MAG: ABC transporter permease [Anaerolinea sp.]|nr:ABC transporter permease [Anaerolinea sp.]